MKTKKISVGQLKEMVKKIIKEEYENNNKEIIITLNHNKSIITIEDNFDNIILDRLEFEPYNDGTIETDYEEMEESLSDYFKKGRANNVYVRIKFISYDGNEINDLELLDVIDTFKELVDFIEDGEKDFDAYIKQ